MSDLIAALRVAWAQRGDLPSTEPMLRACDGVGDGLPGLYIDRLGSLAVVHLHEGSPIEEAALGACADVLLPLYGVQTIYLRVHYDDPRRSARAGARLLGGVRCEATWVHEGRLELLVQPELNVNGGIFLDMREVRRQLGRTCRELQVLNTFCFTGSLGLAAFAGGAREVVQVDISKSILGWARENFQRNATRGQGKMRFIEEDCRAFLRREVRRLERVRSPYVLIILDPPSFGSSGGVTFSLERDLPELLDLAVALLGPGGRLLATMNNRRFPRSELEAAVHRAAGVCQRVIESVTALQPPRTDFTSSSEDSTAMRGVLVSLR